MPGNDKKLNTWKSQGLISQSQLEAILLYEDSLPKTNWSQIGFLILGAGTMALGIISLIAYNWALIPPLVKITIGFAIMFFIAGACYVSQKRASSAAQDGLIALFVLYCFAMIGLIAQVYNLHGPGYQTGLLWSAITLLAVTCTIHYLIPLFWSSVFSLSLLWGVYEWPPIKEAISLHFCLFVISLSVIVVLARRLSKSDLVIKSLQHLAVTFWLINFLSISLTFPRYPYSSTYEKILPHLFASFILAVLVYFDKSIKKFVKSVLLILISFIALSTFLKEFFPDMRLAQNLIGIIAFVGWALAFYAEGYRKLFNFMFVLIAFKVVEIFIQNSSGLLATGLGLVAAGALAVLGIYGWNKNKVILEQRLQELTK